MFPSWKHKILRDETTNLSSSFYLVYQRCVSNCLVPVVVGVAVFNPFGKAFIGTIILVNIFAVNAKRCAFNRIAEVALGYDYRPTDVVAVVQHVGVNRRDAKVELVVIGVYLEESGIVFVDEEGVNIFQSETIGCVAILERDAIGSSHRACSFPCR